MLPTLLPAPTCLGARRFCSKRQPFGSLPVKMKFLGSRTLPNCPKQLQMNAQQMRFSINTFIWEKITWESYSYSLSYSRDLLIVKLNFSLFKRSPSVLARPNLPTCPPLGSKLTVRRPGICNLPLELAALVKGCTLHYSLLLITPFYSLIERTRTRLIADFDVGLRSN